MMKLPRKMTLGTSFPALELMPRNSAVPELEPDRKEALPASGGGALFPSCGSVGLSGPGGASSLEGLYRENRGLLFGCNPLDGAGGRCCISRLRSQAAEGAAIKTALHKPQKCDINIGCKDGKPYQSAKGPGRRTQTAAGRETIAGILCTKGLRPASFERRPWRGALITTTLS